MGSYQDDVIVVVTTWRNTPGWKITRKQSSLGRRTKKNWRQSEISLLRGSWFRLEFPGEIILYKRYFLVPGQTLLGSHVNEPLAMWLWPSGPLFPTLPSCGVWGLLPAPFFDYPCTSRIICCFFTTVFLSLTFDAISNCSLLSFSKRRRSLDHWNTINTNPNPNEVLTLIQLQFNPLTRN